MNLTKKHNQQFRVAGKSFTDGFVKNFPAALVLRSKEPSVCWKAGGQVAFAVIRPLALPIETKNIQLFRIITNAYPPSSLYYHLRSNAVKHHLMLYDGAMLATTPIVQITALLDEIGNFGQWLTQWLDHYVCNYPHAPFAPIPIVSINWDIDGKDVKKNYKTLGKNWSKHLNLWTDNANDVLCNTLNK